MPDLAQRSLAAGEISPSLYGRSNLVSYRTGLRKLWNYTVRAEGGVCNRAGTEYIATTKNSGQSRLIPFIFSVSQSYVGEFGTDYARLYSLGSLATEVVVPYDYSEIYEVAWTQSVDVMTLVHSTYPPAELRRTGASTFTYSTPVYNTGPFRDVNADPSIMVHVDFAFGSVTITATENIFTADHVGGLFYVEEWELSAVAPWTPEETSILVGDYRRNDGKVYRANDAGTTGTVQPTHAFGVLSDGVIDWEFIHSGRGILRITGFTTAKSVSADVVQRIPSTCIGGATSVGHFDHTGNGSTKTFSIATVTEQDRNKYDVQLDGVTQDPATYEIDASANTITFYTAPGASVDIDVDELSVNNRTTFWAFGSWSDEYGNPSEVDYYSDRLIFSATLDEPQTLWFTVVGGYNDFSISVPLEESDAITKTINSRQLNGIQELVPLDDLLILTAGDEHRMTVGQDQIVAEGKIGFKPQSRNGAQRLPALYVDDSALYVQEKGKKIRDLLYNLEFDKYRGNDLTITARHLFKNRTIIDWCYQKEPDGLVWVVLDNGTLVSLTYLRDQEVRGWARHTLPGGTVESICCIPESGEDKVYMVVKRTINGSVVRYIERLANRVFDDLVDGKFLDSCLSYDGRAPSSSTVALTGSGWTVDDTVTAIASASVFASSDVGNEIYLDYGEDTQLILTITAYTSGTEVSVNPVSDVPANLQNVPVSNWGLAKDVFAGLGHLEGESVKALSDGNVVEDLTVASAQVTLPQPGVVVHVGLSFQSELESLDLEATGDESIRSKHKSISVANLLVENTRGIYAGTHRNRMTEYDARSDEDYDESASPITGLVEVYLTSSSTPETRLIVQQNDPLPQTILSMIPEVDIGQSG